MAIQKTLTAGGVVVNNKGEVAVVSQQGISWSLPKGHCDPGESLRETAVREIREETGITELTYVRDLGSYVRFKIGKDGVADDQSEEKEMHFFLFSTTATTLQPEDPENPEARWVPPQEVAHLLTHPKDKEFFLSILSSIV